METTLSKIMFRTAGIGLIIIFMVCNLANGQMIESSNESPQLESYDFHFKKYKANRTAGKILLATGSASFLTGLIINIADVPDALIETILEGESEGEAGTDLGSGLMIGGIVAGLASIPFHIKAKEHKKKLNLLVGTTQTTLENTRLKMPKNIGVSLIIQID
jgi:hypothetical protein